MDETGWQGATIIVVALAVVASVALPLFTYRRLRNPEHRRDAWLSANAQPRLTSALYITFAIKFLAMGLVSAVISAVYGFPLVWALVALSAGATACMIMYLVASIRMHDDVD